MKLKDNEIVKYLSEEMKDTNKSYFSKIDTISFFDRVIHYFNSKT